LPFLPFFLTEDEMPVYKARLNRAEERQYRDHLRQLRAEGFSVEIPEEWEEDSRALDIMLAGPAESKVFESATGGVCYAVLARFVVERSGLILTEWSGSTDYDDQIVPESFHDDRGPVRNLGGQEYGQHEVLNTRIEKNLTLYRDRVVEGWLLATGIAAIPVKYSKFAVVPFRLTLFDQFGHEYVADTRLSVSRKAQRENTRVPRGPGLYGPDATGMPQELSVVEASYLRYRELVAQEKLAQQKKSST
jgi:hypothetical protein